MRLVRIVVCAGLASCYWLGVTIELRAQLALPQRMEVIEVPAKSPASLSTAPRWNGRSATPAEYQVPQNYPPAGNSAIDPAWSGDPFYGPPPAYGAYDCDVIPPGVWSWQLLPDGLIYRSYLAGVKEPRFAGVLAHDKSVGTFVDVTLGGRAGIFRYGTQDLIHPQGWQLDIEGAAFPRINLSEHWDLDSADFRFGVPLTYGVGAYQTKFAYYHLSSHLGDEFMVKNPGVMRINYSRDVLVWGHSYYPTEDVRIYGEVGWAFASDGGSEPWEFQLGAEYSPAYPSGIYGSPFAAINAHLREEVDYGGEFTVQAGWQWRNNRNRHLFRAGLQYFNGKSNQYQFFRLSEQQIGAALWYDY